MIVAFKEKPVTLFGEPIKLGDSAPEVWLKSTNLGTFQVGGKKDKIQVINVVPSLDTPVCATQARTFNEAATSMPNVEMSVVSMDLPFAQSRFCSTEGIKNLHTVSDYKAKEFGKTYGLLITDSALEGLLARAVIIVDTQGKVIYLEICKDIANKPDYEAALNALRDKVLK